MQQLLGERHLVLLSVVSTPGPRRFQIGGAGEPIQIGPEIRGPIIIKRRGGGVRIEGNVELRLDPAPQVMEEGGDGDPAAEAADAERPATADGWVYKLYTLDRHTGVLLDERTLGPMREAIDAGRVIMLDQNLILATSSSTIVVPGAGKR
jgi:hypothetical protein